MRLIAAAIAALTCLPAQAYVEVDPIEYDWSRPKIIDNEIHLPVTGEPIFAGGEYCDFEPKPTGLAIGRLIDDVFYARQEVLYFHLHADAFPDILKDLKQH